MKALSGRVRVLKNSKQKFRLSSKKRLAMSSDLSKDKNEAFLSGVVEGEYCFFQPFSRSTNTILDPLPLNVSAPNIQP